MTDKPLVSVCMITYNHENYIKKAIEGVLMQKTSFLIELIISEDCGTDNTRNIILEYANKYPDKIRVDFPLKNRGVLNNFNYNLSLATGKYIAVCEGDDYWIDPLKLQKQINYLESHINCGLVYGKAKVYIQKENKFPGISFGEITHSYEHLLLVNTIPTLTVCFRTSFLLDYLQFSSFYNKQAMLGDYPLWLYIASKSKLQFFDTILGVYRKLESSASHFDSYKKQLSFIQSGVKIQLLFAEMSYFTIQIRKQILLKYSVDTFYLFLLTHYHIEIWRSFEKVSRSRYFFCIPFMAMQLVLCKSPFMVHKIEKIKRCTLNLLIKHY